MIELLRIRTLSAGALAVVRRPAGGWAQRGVSAPAKRVLTSRSMADARMRSARAAGVSTKPSSRQGLGRPSYQGCARLRRYSSFLAFKSSRLGNLSLSLYNAEGGDRWPERGLRQLGRQSLGWFQSHRKISLICVAKCGRSMQRVHPCGRISHLLES